MGQERSIKELHAFLREVADRPFKWGVWDCLIFTNTAFRRMYGKGWGDDLYDRYMDGDRPLPFSVVKQEYGYQSAEDAVRDRLPQAYNVPPRGALVLASTGIIDAEYMGVGFGISVGSNAAFVSKAGVVYYPIEYIDSAWVRNDDAA
jgi:hypothetical protein